MSQFQWQRHPARARPRPAARPIGPGPAPEQRTLLREVLGQPVQTRLKVGAPDDVHEREAEAVADRVMTSSEPVLQRQCTQCADEKDKPEDVALQRLAQPTMGALASVQPRTVSAVLAQGLASSRGGGQPLPHSERSFFESRLGVPLGAVRVHTGPQAAAWSAELGARAFTLGRDVYFGAGEYQPGSSTGRHLMAHELAHTLQQAPPAHDAAGRGMRGQGALRLSAASPGIARQPRAAPATSGHLTSDPNWSYVVYASEVRLRYYRDLPKDAAEERKKKNLPGFVQVGTIPWISNNPGNITQESGASPNTLKGLPSTLGSMGIYGGRYSIFPSEKAGVDAIGPYLSKRPSVTPNPDMSMASSIKQYKGEERAEKAAREAREKENAARVKEGKPPLPPIDVREKYLADVRQRMQARMARDEAMEGGDDIDNLPAQQRRQVNEDVKKRIDAFMSGRATDAPQDDDALRAAVQSIHEVEGKAASPGVIFSCSGFVDPTKTAAYDGEQKALIARLIGSEAAKKELQSLLGCP